ncbi:NADPH2:quinone reductase [Pontimonas salivibrio]|uniref:NADPH2:quinone reductase n=1 Tax=Pontimonas salivibrio TaxID=1159327 RepID=A0A2L2BNA8_9MICO|nr:quinone oxidoreductase [Pontimonas salivibrio]AVG23127.1 NADPH2:quinone reductase [Pontimonas salivibrio]
MRAIQISHTGGPDVLEYVELDPPSAGDNEVVVKVHAIGVNYIDTYHREGAYPLPLPFTPGQEGAGEVVEVGPGISEWSVGDRVCWAMVGGSYAEYVAVPLEALNKVPDSIDFSQAAAAMLQGLTAHYLCTNVYPVDQHTTAVVHAVAGGVGLLLTQMIRSRGGTVIGTTSSAEKAQRGVDAGAQHVIRYDKEPWAERVQEITGGRGVDVVYDGVGKDTFEGSLSSLRPRGTLALYGAASGPVPPFDLQRLGALGSLIVTRPTLGHFMADHTERAWRTSELFGAIESGQLNVSIAASFALSDAPEGHRAIQSRDYSGKILLIP